MDIFYVQQGETTAARRLVPVKLVSGTDYLKPWTGTLAGSPKATLALDNGTDADSDNAYTMQDGTNHPGIALVQLSEAEVADRGDLMITINKGNGFGQTLVRIVDFPPGEPSSDLALHAAAGRPS